MFDKADILAIIDEIKILGGASVIMALDQVDPKLFDCLTAPAFTAELCTDNGARPAALWVGFWKAAAAGGGYVPSYVRDNEDRMPHTFTGLLALIQRAEEHACQRANASDTYPPPAPVLIARRNADCAELRWESSRGTLVELTMIADEYSGLVPYRLSVTSPRRESVVRRMTEGDFLEKPDDKASADYVALCERSPGRIFRVVEAEWHKRETHEGPIPTTQDVDNAD